MYSFFSTEKYNNLKTAETIKFILENYLKLLAAKKL